MFRLRKARNTEDLLPEMGVVPGNFGALCVPHFLGTTLSQILDSPLLHPIATLGSCYFDALSTSFCVHNKISYHEMRSVCYTDAKTEITQISVTPS